MTVQSQIIDQLQSNLNDHKNVVKELVSKDNRIESLQSLQNRFDEISLYLLDQ